MFFDASTTLKKRRADFPDLQMYFGAPILQNCIPYWREPIE